MRRVYPLVALLAGFAAPPHLVCSPKNLPEPVRAAATTDPGDSPVRGVRGVAVKRRQSWTEVVERDRAAPPPGPTEPSPHWQIPPVRPTDSLRPEVLATFPHSPDQPAAPPPAIDGCGPFIGNLLPGAQFEALPDNMAAIPPDTMGAIGLRHAMTMLNTEVRIQDRAGMTEYTRVGLASFWPTLAAPFDPKTYHDNNALRWLTVCLGSRDSTQSNWAIQVSDTSDPTGDWTTVTFDADATDTRWCDFPCVGFNGRWVVVTFNMFAVTGVPMPGPIGAKMWVIDKSELFGPGQTVTFWEFDVGFVPGAGFTLQPAVVHDALEDDLLLIDNTYQVGMQTGRNLLRLSRLSGATQDPQWSALPGSNYTTPGYFEAPFRFTNERRNAPQQGSPTPIEIGDARACNAVYRNGRLWFSHSGGVIMGGTAQPETAIYWYELEPVLPNPVVQGGILVWGANEHVCYPSIAVNCNGDACIGYSLTSADRFISSACSTRRVSDPPGTLTSTTILAAGGASYVRLGNMRNRWGDYSATVTDPIDHMGFWTIQESATTTANQWTTRWSQVPHDCPGAPVYTSQPRSVSVCLGSPASLSAHAPGANSYQWLKDGDPVSGAYGPTLTFPSANIADTGEYRVIAYSSCGSSQSEIARLQVGAQIIQDPIGVLVAEPCQTAQLAVQARGVGALSYQWYRQGALGLVPLANDGHFSGVRTATLTINGVRYADEGLYRVQVFDSCPNYSPVSGASRLTIPGSPQWVRRTSSGPPRRLAYTTDMAYDETRGVCVLYGGFGATGPSTSDYLGDTWEWDGAEWIERVLPHTPGPRREHELAFDPTRGTILLFGGWSPATGFNADVWEYDGDDWTLLTTSPGGPTTNYTMQGDMTFDSARGKLVLLTEHIFGPTPTNKTWEFDTGSLTWTSTHEGVGPYHRTSPLVYDPARNQIVSQVMSFTLPWLNTWAYSGAWSTLPNVVTPDRYWPVMAYDSVRKRVTMYGCCRDIGSPAVYRTDTHAFDGAVWWPLLPDFHSAPEDAPVPAAMAFDSRRRAMVMVGNTYNNNVAFNPMDTWEYRYLESVVIDRHPADQTLKLGQAAAFDVLASGAPDLTYRWRRNGAPLSNGTTPAGSTISGATTSMLQISGLAAADAGSYDCLVTNGCGSTASNAATLGCYADCDGSAALNIFDFLCFQDAFVTNNPYADCDGNNVLDIFDFLCFQDGFVTGCK